MKVTIAFLAVLVVASAIPLPEAPLNNNLPLEHSEIRDDFGQYALSYLTDRASHVEQGSLKQINGAVVLVKRGSYVFIDGNGQRYLTSYIADEKGFRAVGDHIPIPAAVQV